MRHFALSSSLSFLLDAMNLMHTARIDPEQQKNVCFTYIALMAAYLFFHFISIMADKWVTKEPTTYFMFKFLRLNFIKAEDRYKKFVRLFDTLGSFLGLVALVLGVFSLLCDQYDIEFEPEGQLKEMKDSLDGFYGSMKSVVDDLESIAKALNYKVTCETIYEAMGVSFLAGVGASFIPGKVSGNLQNNSKILLKVLALWDLLQRQLFT